MANRIVDLKEDYFGTADVEIKSTWLRNPDSRQKHYLEKFNISADKLTSFVDEYYELICDADIKIVAAVIDKLEMEQKYSNPYYPPATAYEALMMRVESDLSINESVAVIIDDTSGTTPKGNHYKTLLDAQHKSLKQNGGKLKKGFAFPSLTSLRFVNSATSHLVQAADICAYCVYRQFVNHGPDWEVPGEDGKLPMYEYFERIHRKFRCSDRGIVQGYGLIKLPEKAKMRWGIDR